MLTSDAKSGENMTVGHVDEGITDVVEVKRERGQGMQRGTVLADASSEIWCIHGNSKLACWDAATFSSGQCKHVGVGRVSGLVSLANGQVWSGSSDGRISVWNAKNKRVIRALGMRHTSACVSIRQSAYVSILVWNVKHKRVILALGV